MSQDEPLPGMPEPERICYVSGAAMGGYGPAASLAEDMCVLEIVLPFAAIEGKSLRDLNMPLGRERLAYLLLTGKMPDKA